MKSKKKYEILKDSDQSSRANGLRESIYMAKLYGVKRRSWKHMTAARLIFKGDVPTLTYLGLHETRFDALYPWTRQTKNFYLKVLDTDEILEKLIQYGISEEDLVEGLSKLNELEGNKYWKKQVDEEWAEGEYKLQESYGKLKEWMTEFEDTVRVACKDKPEHVVKLGLEKSVEDVIERQKLDERRAWKKILEEKAKKDLELPPKKGKDAE